LAPAGVARASRTDGEAEQHARTLAARITPKIAAMTRLPASAPNTSGRRDSGT
jgi:hypothetical protein